MYKTFYGLIKSPFDISPDPHFYYPTPRHNEALANLWHGVQQRKGCVVLTGEIGTGKTMLARHIMAAFSCVQLPCAYIFNPRLSLDDFPRNVLTGLGVRTNGASRGQMLSQLEEFLQGLYRQGSTAALIVDEAHLLSSELLEEVRLLNNLENAQQKFLQILLVGQPELDRSLERPELQPLKQRIMLRCRLEPLGEKDVGNYIAKRLQMAGAGDNATRIFSPAAVAQIMRYSRGTPRVINTICESCLIAGYARQLPAIGPEIVDTVAADFRLAAASPPRVPDGSSLTDPAGGRNCIDAEAAPAKILAESCCLGREREVRAQNVGRSESQ